MSVLQTTLDQWFTLHLLTSSKGHVSAAGDVRIILFSYNAKKCSIAKKIRLDPEKIFLCHLAYLVKYEMLRT